MHEPEKITTNVRQNGWPAGSHTYQNWSSTGTRSTAYKVNGKGKKQHFSPPPRAEVMYAWGFTSTPPYLIAAWCFQHRVSSTIYLNCRYRWPCGLRSISEAAWLLESSVRIPLRAWLFISTVTGIRILSNNVYVKRLCNKIEIKTYFTYIYCMETNIQGLI
jgi:hypothetical protein